MTDYISREAAFNALLKLVPKVDDDGYCWIIRGDAATAIDNIPAADVRPVVRARWNTVKYPLYECSNCGAVYQDVGYGFNFCPNCGADMRAEDGE